MRYWRPNEISFIKKYYNELGKSICSERLSRSPQSVFSKAQRMGICSRPRPKDGGKICRCCGVEKPFRLFYKNKCRNDGVSSYCIDCHKSKNQQNKPLLWAIHTIRSHIKRGNTISFSARELQTAALINSTCAFCGRVLSWENHKVKKDSPTLERLNNNHDLHLHNIAIICHQCNSSKRDRSLSEYLIYLKTVTPVIENLLKQQESKQ